MDDEVRFLDILTALTRNDVEFVVVGGVAAILEGAPISTFDLDVVYRRSATNNARLATALRQVNARYKDLAGRHIVPDATKLATVDVNLLVTDLGDLDVLHHIRGDLDYEELLERTVEYEVADLHLQVANLETVIESKELADRDKDRAALPILRRTLEVKRAREGNGFGSRPTSHPP